MRLKLISYNYYRNLQKRCKLVAKKHLPWYLEAFLTCRFKDAWIAKLLRIEKVFSNAQDWQSPVFSLSRRLQSRTRGSNMVSKPPKPHCAYLTAQWRGFAKQKVCSRARSSIFIFRDRLRLTGQSIFTK